MPVWNLPTVEEEPSVRLQRWKVQRFTHGDSKWDFLIGYDVGNACGRCSTRILEFAPASATATTESGRKYVLEAKPGFDSDAQYVFQRRFGKEFPAGYELKDASPEYWTRICESGATVEGKDDDAPPATHDD